MNRIDGGRQQRAGLLLHPQLWLPASDGHQSLIRVRAGPRLSRHTPTFLPSCAFTGQFLRVWRGGTNESEISSAGSSHRFRLVPLHSSQLLRGPFRNLTASVPHPRPLSQRPELLRFSHFPRNPTKQRGGKEKGTQGSPTLVAPPRLPPKSRHREAAAQPAGQRLTFILSGTWHPGSMKWSLIIKLKSLSAEQFKWRKLSGSRSSLPPAPHLSGQLRSNRKFSCFRSFMGLRLCSAGGLALPGSGITH